MRIFAALFKSSVARWPIEPTPAEPYVSSPGFARTAAMYSAGVLTANADDTASSIGPSPTSATGTKSPSGSYGNLAGVAATVRKVDEVNNRTEPSRGALA